LGIPSQYLKDAGYGEDMGQHLKLHIEKWIEVYNKNETQKAQHFEEEMLRDLKMKELLNRPSTPSENLTPRPGWPREPSTDGTPSKEGSFSLDQSPYKSQLMSPLVTPTRAILSVTPVKEEGEMDISDYPLEEFKEKSDKEGSLNSSWIDDYLNL